MTEAAEVSPKLASRIAHMIESDIIAAGWPVGDVLGSEVELRIRYGVSRSALREAVRIVEHHRVATMRRGPSGGLVVRAPDATPSARALVIYLAQVRTTIPHLMYARQLLEPIGAGLAAQSLTDDGLQRLSVTLETEARSPGADTQEALHVTLGELSGNVVIALFTEVLVLLTRHYASVRWDVARIRRAKAESCRIHRKIIEATIEGDAALTQHRMREHLRALEEWLDDGPSAQAAGASFDLEAPVQDGSDQMKLAEILADRIRLDLTRRDLAPGDFICSENELLLRCGTSKAVLREAVRLLEYHSVAFMRRGPGGGLFMGRPDPTASAEAIALYFEYKGIDFDALRIVRDAVELGCIEAVVARRHEDGVAERLRAALCVDPGTAADPDTMKEQAHAFHTELARLTDNPVLAVFEQILSTLSVRHASTIPRTGPAWSQPELATEVARTHGGIVEAILGGDVGLAKYRMRRHLQTLSTQWWH